MATKDLATFRKKIDKIDDRLVALLIKRMNVVKELDIYKKQHNIVPLDTTRRDEILKKQKQVAKKNGIDPAYVAEVYEKIHEHSLRVQKKR
jgi:chorismate mutase